VLDEREAERVSVAFGQLAARLTNRQVLQLYVQASPLPLEALLVRRGAAHKCRSCAGRTGAGAAMRALAAGQAQSLRAHTESAAAVELRHM